MKIRGLFGAIYLFSSLAIHAKAGSLEAVHLRCEYKENPVGIDNLQPRFSWQMRDDKRNSLQSAFQLMVASSMEDLKADKADVWDSQKTASEASLNVAMPDKNLNSKKRYFWKVRIWDEKGKASGWSAINYFEMGLLNPSDWKASWISMPGSTAEGPCPYFRKKISAGQAIARARVYVTARGLYQVFINGKRVGDDYFTPGSTDYTKRIQYQAYDVTNLLNAKDNEIGAMIGDGWFCGHSGFITDDKPNNKLYGDHPSFLMQLEIDYTNGNHEVISTDNTWKTKAGPVLTSDILNGVTYDARQEMPGWSTVNFDDSSWKPVMAENRDNTLLVAQYGPTVKKISELKPVKLFRTKSGTWVWDMGQNMVGIVRLKLKGVPGDTAILRYAEMLDKDSMIYTDNLRSAKCTDKYVFRSNDGETYESDFTYHGFRYVEISKYTGGEPGIDAITGIVMHSNTPPAGTFECSNKMINKLQSNITWSQRSNFFDIPTDCPQRDERLGWTGDAQIFIKTACFNMDVASFFYKWSADMRDAQFPNGAFADVAPNKFINSDLGVAGWGDAGVICPWTIYQNYNDLRILSDNYQAMTRWVEYLKDKSDNLIRPARGYGDWVSINSDTPKDLLATAFFAYSTDIVSRTAYLLGKPQDGKKYRDLFENIKSAFNKEFVTETGRIVGNTQTSYLLALKFNLLPKEKRAVAATNLIKDIQRHKGYLTTGFIGVSFLLPVLTETGYRDTAYKLLLNEGYPSWGFEIKNGATTIWERWNGWTPEKGFMAPDMNSFNHYSFGSVGEWLYSVVGGIKMDTTGNATAYKKIIIQPQPGGGITSAKAELESSYGKIASDWKLEKKTFSIHVVIPPNTSALVILPAASADNVKESTSPLTKDKGIMNIQYADGLVSFEIGSGDYMFSSGIR